jgi:hypothetical protein
VPKLSPLPYHRRVCHLVQRAEPALYEWFESDAFGDEHADAVRLELLKSTYRMEPEAHPALYAAAGAALRALELDIPVAFYQAQTASTLNAALCFLPGEAHVVLQGPILATFSTAELTALIGHELAHYKLWTEDEGAHRIAMNLVEAMAQHPGAEPSHLNTARRLRRYTEIYADRGALLASTDPFAAIGCLVKVHTGLGDVDPRAYLKQAEEILSRGPGASEEDTHPEAFIRARALWLWHERESAADSEVAELLQHVASLDDLDLLDQVELSAATRAVVEALLQPAWFRTERVLAHARLYFADFAPKRPAPLEHQPWADSEAIAEYIAYVLLDFTVVDPELGDVALGYTLRFATDLGCGPAFERAVRKELKRTQPEIEALGLKLSSLLERVERQEGSSA